MRKRLVKRWRVLLALSTVLLFGLTIVPKLVYATEESDTWAIPSGSVNGFQENIQVTSTKIIQIGTHVKGTSKVFYRTTGYYMTLVKVNDTYSKSGAFDSVNKAYVPVKVVDDDQGTKVVSTYTIQKEDFIDAMQKLGVTSEQLNSNNGYITVYLNNIFELYNPQTGKVYSNYQNIFGYQEMMDAAYSITGGHIWAGDTPTILQSYYNFPYKVYPTLFNVEVHAATEVNGSLQDLGVLKSSEPGMFKESYPQDGPFTAPKSHTFNGVNYTAKGYWFCRYTTRSSGTLIQGIDHTGLTISDFKLPDAAKDSKVILYVPYVKDSVEAKMVIQGVDKDTGTVIAPNLYTSTISPCSQINQAVNTSVLYNGNTYTKTVDCSYVYTKTGGAKESIKFTTASANDPVKFTVPSDIKDNSTILVTVYYQKSSPGSIPVTVIAVDKSTGSTIKTIGTGTATGGSIYNYGTDIADSITSGTKTYSYTGEWGWSYIKNTTTAPTIQATGSGTKISFTVPSADEVKSGSGGITVKVYYDGAARADIITLRVIMVTSTGGTIKELSTEMVTRDQLITKTAPESESVNGIVYTYQNKWDYTYITTSGSQGSSGTGTTASFKIPTAIMLGTTVTLRFYYDGIQPVEVPDPSDPISVSLDSPSPYGVINGDKYSSPYFTSKLGISTTESQYVYVKTKDYLLGYTLVNRTGKVTYYVPVTMHYTLKYYSATPTTYGGPKLITENGTYTKKVKIEEAYSYWEIIKLEYYHVSKADVYNYSLPGGSVSLSADNRYTDIPVLSTWHSEQLEDHVLAPQQVTDGIDVYEEEPYTSTTSDRPEIEYKDLTAYAYKQTDKAKVKNDYLSFDGVTILSSTATEKEAPSPTNTGTLSHCTTLTGDKALYTDCKVIQATKNNGVYSSNGSVTYYLDPDSINCYQSPRVYNVNVNSVTIHTPVICDPIINSDNSQWAQLIRPVSNAVQIVLDPKTSLNDFTVKISNTLEHSNRLGYYTRDFSKSFIDPVNVSYIAKTSSGFLRNEMKLPFDVYIDILADGNQSNDKFVKAGTWIVMSTATAKFYVPMWVQEGIYTAEFRSISVNGADKLTQTESTRNSSINKYVATSTKTFQISGRLYGLTLYDISDYPKWENVFRKDNTMLFKYFEGAIDGTKQTGFHSDYAYYYTVGTNDQYGNANGRFVKYTFPLVNGSHPKYSNLGVLKTGYAVRFRLDTTGEMYSSDCYVKITPTFYYVDANGKNRQQVDLYYSEEINGKNYNLIKVGNGIDLTNIQSGNTGNIYSRIPKSELAQTAAVLNTTYSKIIHQSGNMYSYNQVRLIKAFRTYIGTGYANFITSLSSFSDVSSAVKQTKTSLSKYMQRWYGTYKIPTNVHVVPSGYNIYDYLKKHGIDYRESFWLKDGYIIVNFNIVTVDKNGNQHLSYINTNNYLNNNHCSMWVKEEAPLQKTDYKSVTFNFKAGDFIIYFTDKKSSDDYTGNLY